MTPEKEKAQMIVDTVKYEKFVTPAKKYIKEWWCCYSKSKIPKKTGLFYSWVFVWKDHRYEIKYMKAHKHKKQAMKRAYGLYEKRITKLRERDLKKIMGKIKSTKAKAKAKKV